MAEAHPRWATPRSPERVTLGKAAWKVSNLIGQPLMGWQRSVADVAMEVVDDAGRFAYRNVILTIPRQNGKTTLLLAMVVARALLAPGTRMVYCAQSALDAKKKWREDWVPALDDSPLKDLVKVRWAPGDEGMTFFNGSRISIVASTEKAGHGITKLDIAIVDEAFAYRDGRLEQALRPAMLVQPNAQLWIVSTAGTPSQSPYLWAKVTGGRQFVEEDRRSGTCYFEWSATDDADAGDPATWRACMPALGRTITEETIATDFESMAKEGKLSEFQRAYLNRWVLAMGDPIVPLDHWQSLSRSDAPRPPWVVLGLSVAPEDASASVVACGEDLTGLQSTVVEHGDGVDWLLPSTDDPVGALGRLMERYDNPPVVVDEKRCGHLLPEIERTCPRVVALKASEIPQACAWWLRMVKESHLTHCGEPELTVALAGAGRSGGRSWQWAPEKSGADISPLEAQTLAASYWKGAWGGEDGGNA